MMSYLPSQDPRWKRVYNLLYYSRDNAASEDEYNYIESVIDDLNAGIKNADDIWYEMQIGSIRNAGFYGDEIGWLPDDFN